MENKSLPQARGTVIVWSAVINPSIPLTLAKTLRAGGRQVPRGVEKAEVSTVVGHREGGWRLFVLQFLGLSCAFEGHWSQGKSDETCSLENSPCSPPLQFHEHFQNGQDACVFPKLTRLTPNVMACEDGTCGKSLGWDEVLSALRRRLTARQEPRESQEESSHQTSHACTQTWDSHPASVRKYISVL